MATLRDALSNLQDQSHQIRALALQTSTQPLAGRFTNAYLNGGRNIFSIIREAVPHERSLFSFIGEGDAAGQNASNTGGGEGAVKGNMVERRKPGLVTPLRKTNQGKGGSTGSDDPVKLLRTALTLVDEYRSMPRARAHVVNLLDSFAQTRQEIQDLEDQIESAKKGLPPTQTSSSHQDQEAEEGTDMGQDSYADPDEWLRAEEEAVRQLEKEIGRLRRSQPITESKKDEFSSPTSSSANQMNGSATPLTKTARPVGMGFFSPGTPVRDGQRGKSKLGSPLKRGGKAGSSKNEENEEGLKVGQESVDDSPHSPHSPRRKPSEPVGGPSGSSPSSSTPRFAQPTTSSLAAKINALTPSRHKVSVRSVSSTQHAAGALGRVQGAAEGTLLSLSGRGVEGRSGRRVQSGPSPGKNSPRKRMERERDEEREKEEDEETDLTLTPTRASRPVVRKPDEETLGLQQGSDDAVGPDADTNAGPTATVEGVWMGKDGLEQEIDKVWQLVPDILRCDEASPEVLNGNKVGVEDTIKLIARIAGIRDIRPPSPSTISIHSSSAHSTNGVPLPKPTPSTEGHVLLANLILVLLRGETTQPELKARLEGVCKERGWEERLGMSTIYGGVAKRLIKIDRRDRWVVRFLV